MIPLVGFLVSRNVSNNKNKQLKLLGLWFIPVFLIPLIWPIYAIYLNQYHEWTAGVLLQMHRISQPLILSIDDFYKKDPVLLIFGIAGLTLAAIKKRLVYITLGNTAYNFSLFYRICFSILSYSITANILYCNCCVDRTCNK